MDFAEPTAGVPLGEIAGLVFDARRRFPPDALESK
jgi:hypothetical protein